MINRTRMSNTISNDVNGLIEKASQHGIKLSFSNDDLILNMHEEMEPDPLILDELRTNKKQLISYLRTSASYRDKQYAIERFDRQVEFPIQLSFNQERLWFIHRVTGSVHYHAPIAIRIKGHLNEDTLTYALNEIVNRHEVLRTVIREMDGQPYQKIIEKDGMILTIIDGQSYKDEAGDLSKEIQKLIAIPFDLSRDHMLRAHLIRLTEADRVLVLNMHHIASDGRSLQIIERELIELYTARSQRRDPQLAPLQIQYADFAMWQRRYAGDSMMHGKLEYWKHKLEGVEPLQLQSYLQPATVRGHEGSAISFSIDMGLLQQLYGLGRRYEATLFMVLLGAFKLLLYKYTGQRDICVGSAITGRQRRELEDLVGFFMDTLPLRTQVNPDLSFSRLLQAVKTTTLEAYDHQEVPFEKIVEAVVRHRDPHQSPLFQVMFDLQNRTTGETGELALQDLAFVREPLEINTAKYDLTFSFEESTNGLYGTVSYSSRLYNGQAIREMMRHYIQLLQAVAAAPDQPIAGLEMLGEEERRRLLAWSQGPQVAYPVDRTVVELFREQAGLHPDGVAVVFQQERLSYAELEARSNQLGHYLRRLGVCQESLVAICVDRSPGMVPGILGILKAGGAYVPVDPSYPQDRIAYMLSDTGSRCILTDQATRDRLPDLAGVQVVVLEEAMIDAEPTTPPAAQLHPDHLAYVIYTSGSTGRPKGVMIEHRSLVNYLSCCRDGYLEQRADTAGSFVYLSYSFDAAVTALFVPLIAGRPLIISTSGRSDNVFDGPSFHRDAPYDFLKLTPAHLSLLQEAWTAGAPPTKRLVIGGEALGGHHLDPWTRQPDQLEIVNEYGPTETTVGCSIYRCYTGGGATPPPGNIPIGRPMANTRLLILDGDGRLSPQGVAGELYIGGVQVARGYWGREELTAERFVADPFGGTGRLYRTGDRCRWMADGNIEYLGRMDEQVKIRGYRIEPGEVESVLSKATGVKAAAVVVREDRSGDQRLVGYVVMEDGADPEEGTFDPGRLMGYLQARLPEYMVPAQLVQLEALPLTTSGKVDRKALPGPEQESTAGYAGPRDAMEAALVRLWQELLEVEPVGIHDDFFALGGHSLLAIRLIAAIRKQLTTELTIKEVFDHPTIAGLAAVMRTKTSGAQAAVLRAFDRTGPVPLSFSQERLWFIDRLEGSVAYHIPWVFRVEGPLDIEALSASLRQVLMRHEVLRSVIVEQDGRGYQQVQPLGDWQPDYEAERWVGRDEPAVRAELDRWLRQPFDLTARWPLRVRVLRLGEEQYLLAGVLHHIASDGWSVGVLVKELTQGYRDYAEGTTPALPQLPIQYGDYALWQREEAQQQALQQQLDYWKGQLPGLEVPELPADHPRPAQPSGQGAAVDYRVDARLLRELQALSNRQGATLFMTLLAVWKIVLWRYTGQPDIAVGSPVAGREHAELEELIGFFINTVVLRSRLEGQWSFEQLLTAVKEMTLSAYAHQQAPFEQVVEAVAVNRDLSRTPLFQVLFVLQNTPDVEALELGRVKLFAEDSSMVLSKFDLTLSASEQTDGLSLQLVYSVDLFEQPRMQRMLEHYVRLLQAVAAAPARPIAELEMLDEEEKCRLLSWSQGPQVAYPRDRTVVELFREQALRSPGAVAIVYEQEQLSYAGLEARSNQLGHYLRKLGVREDSLVAICMDRSLNMVPGILGILKAGGAYVPVDPAYPQERIAYMLSDADSRYILTDRVSSGRLPELPGVQVLVLEEAMIEAEPTTPPSTRPRPDSLAYMIYTSGSTGRPKGVLIEHRSLVNRLQWAQSKFGLGPDDAVLQKTTFCFDVSVWELLWPLLTGSRIVMARPDGHRDSEYLKRMIREQGITTIHFVPSMLSAFLETLAEGDMDGLRRIICSGEALTPAQVGIFQMKAGDTRLYNLYGPTEAAIDVSYWDAPEGQQRVEVVPIGRPVANTRLLILDMNGHLSPEGVAGELYIGGVQVARGYWRQDQLTEQRFVADPFGGTERLYRTGDRCRWMADGNIEYLGRMDDQVKIRGYRIEPGEVESVLSGAEGVKAAVVVVREGPGGDRRLVGYVVMEGTFDREAVLTYLRSRLPEYMVPAQLVRLEALPLTASGKADRKALPQPEQENAIAYEGPGNATEAALVELWHELLERDRIGINDNFFSLGGHSLLAMRLVAAIRRRLDREVSLVDIFLHPTVAGQSLLLEAGGGAPAKPPLKRREHTGPMPVSFSQERFWFIDRLEGSLAYHIPWVFRLDKDVDTEILEASLRTLVNRHESLRTVIREDNGSLYQHILDENGWRLASEMRPDISESVLKDRIQQLISHPFDLSKDHMLRASVIQTGADQKILIITLHHIAADGWTVGILAREWALSYAVLAGQNVAALPPLAIRYADYAVWQREYWNSGLLKKKTQYWSQKLRGITTLQLPGDQRGHVQSQAGSAVQAALPQDVLQRLQKYCRGNDVTLFMVLLAVLKVFLYRYTGNKDICVGSPVSGRHYYELENLAGYFLNTLPIRTAVTPDAPFSDYLAQVKQTVLEAYENQDVPLEKIVEAAGKDRDVNKDPLFRVMLALQNNPPEEMGSHLLAEAILSGDEVDTRASKFDILLVAEERRGQLGLKLEYNNGLFNSTMAQRMLGHFEQLLQSALNNPGEPIAHLPMLVPDERHMLTGVFNRPAGPIERQTVTALFEHQVRSRPQTTALVFDGRSLSYFELDRRSNQLAHYLQRKGVRDKDLVPIYIERCPDMIISVLAVLKIGGTYVPIDIDYPEIRVRDMLIDCGSRLVISNSRSASRFNGYIDLLVLDVDKEAAAIESESQRAVEVDITPDHLVYILYTSGSTGRPKGVQMHMEALVNLLDWQQKKFQNKHQRRVLQFASLNFDVSFQEIFSTLCYGNTLFLIGNHRRQDIPQLAKDIGEFGITHLFVPYIVLKSIAEHLQDIKDYPASLEEVVTAGEQLKLTEDIRLLMNRTQAQLVNQYGPTEAHVVSSYVVESSDYIMRPMPPIGKPIDNLRLHILNENRELCPIGVQGEIYIEGAGVAKGYLDLPVLTDQKFVHGFSENNKARLYRTGDWGRWLEDGNIEYIGRMDGQVKIRGHRVEPGEIETRLQQSGLVTNGVVLAKKDSMGNNQLIAYVVAPDPFNKEDLILWLKARLPAYMVPSIFVRVESIPFNANGKVDRPKLEELYTDDPGKDEDYIAPTNETESVLAEIWKEHLNIERVGIRDLFFSLGGHSLLMTPIASSIAKRLDVYITFQALFENPTIEELAAYIVNLKNATPGEAENDDNIERFIYEK